FFRERSSDPAEPGRNTHHRNVFPHRKPHSGLPFIQVESSRPVNIASEHLQRALNLRDLSNPAHGGHAMQSVVASLIHSLTRAWACPAILHRASPSVSIVDNYERLRYPADAAARDARYTRYLSKATLLRTHTSAMIPPLLDRLAAEPPADDILLAPVGLVYRRDVIDRLHVGEPHQ